MTEIKAVWKDRKYILILGVIAELAGLFLFLSYGYHWLKLLRYLSLIGFMVVLGTIDSREQIIPNKILIVMLLTRGFLLVGELVCFKGYWRELLLSAITGLILGFLIFLIAYVLSRKSIGLGDVKLAGVLGWYLGSSLIWWNLVVCLLLAAVYSIVQLARKKVGMKDSIPLGPFLSLGTILVLLLGF